MPTKRALENADSSVEETKASSRAVGKSVKRKRGVPRPTDEYQQVTERTIVDRYRLHALQPTGDVLYQPNVGSLPLIDPIQNDPLILVHTSGGSSTVVHKPTDS